MVKEKLKKKSKLQIAQKKVQEKLMKRIMALVSLEDIRGICINH